MEHNYPLQNNFNNAYSDNFDNLQLTNMIQSSSNVFYDNANSSGTYTDLTSDNIISTSTASDGLLSTCSTTPCTPQYIGHSVNEQNQNLLQNPSQNPPQYIQSPCPSFLNYPQTNETFTFEIPGFRIIVVPTTPPIANNNSMQNQAQQDLNYSNIVTDISQTQFQQQNSLNLNNFNNFHGNFDNFRG